MHFISLQNAETGLQSCVHASVDVDKLNNDDIIELPSSTYIIFTRIDFWMISNITAFEDLSLPLTRRFKHDPDTDVLIYDDLVSNHPDKMTQKVFTF